MKLLLALALMAPSVVLAQACCEGKEGKKGSDTPVVAKMDKGVQKLTVLIDGGYSPSVIQVAKGKPVELTFTRKSDNGCDGTLVVKPLKFRKDLKKGESTVVKFTPTKAEEIPFACGMAMLKGKILVK